MLIVHSCDRSDTNFNDRGIGLSRIAAIGTLAFLTVVDLFATQAILPALAAKYGVDAATIGVAVNASTLGMATAGLGVAYFGGNLAHRRTVTMALAALAIPTVLLAFVPNLLAFAALRVVQGLLMATAFALTLSSLAATSGRATGTAFAAYVTGNVASNLFGRLMSASIADMLGVQANFLAFAVLNLVGACLALVVLLPDAPAVQPAERAPQQMRLGSLLRERHLAGAFAIGFCILFAFIGTFTYVNFVLVQPPLSLGMMSVGLVYFVFLPSIVTTPMAGALAQRFGTRAVLWSGLAIAATGLPMLLAGALPTVLAGLALVGVGTFLAQAATTGFVGRAASADATAANGLYLACYFLGGLIGSAVLGQAYVHFGWTACVTGIGVALGIAAILARQLVLPTTPGAA